MATAAARVEVPLAQLVDAKLRAAGIGPDDPALVKLRAWNREVTGAGPPDTESLAPPPDAEEGRELDMAGMTQCSREGCGADIEWAVSAEPGRDTKMPVDYWSAGDQRGRVAVHREGGQLMFRMLTKAEPDLRRGEKRGVAHWVTCKNPPPKKTKAKPAGDDQ